VNPAKKCSFDALNKVIIVLKSSEKRADIPKNNEMYIF
jgi:hypothetical protein